VAIVALAKYFESAGVVCGEFASKFELGIISTI
jgi:hypothetical protein